MKKHKHIKFDFDEEEINEAIKRIKKENKNTSFIEPCIEGKKHHWICEKIGFDYPITKYKETCIHCKKEKIICIANFK